MLPPSDAEAKADPTTPGTQIHEMVLTYKFDVAPDGDDKTVEVSRHAEVNI